MNETRIRIAKPDIVKHFDGLSQKVLKQTDIAQILTRMRAFWRLAQRTTTSVFIKFLMEHARLKRLEFPFPYRKEVRYSWGAVPLLEALLTLKAGSYYSHYTAVRMHGLTEQIPKTIYLNHEQPPHAQGGKLEQGRIDAAFARRPRVSHNVIELEDVRVCLVNGMHTGELGVVEEEVRWDGELARVRLTNLERTLIDIAVRPVYSGGVWEVLKAYEQSKDRVSVNRLAANLQSLNYLYPYHQAIGFYLERAGFKSSAVNLLRRFPMDFDFHLANEIKEKQYVKAWRLYVPKGF
jgi:hypothetical protein